MLESSTGAHMAQLRMQLAQMTAASQLLERYATDEKSRAYLSTINQSVCRMLRLVGRLELARRLTDEDEVRLQVAPLDITRWGTDLARRLEGALAGANVSFTWEVAPGLSGVADGGMLEQLVLELVSNAAKTGSPVKLTVQPGTGSVRITVSDQGPGLDAQQLSTLFQQPPQEEQGMGVALAQQIAQLHGGLLMADSKLGYGVNMVAVIPLRDGMPPRRLETPLPQWGDNGLDPVLVGLSDVLPAQSFAPDTLG